MLRVNEQISLIPIFCRNRNPKKISLNQEKVHEFNNSDLRLQKDIPVAYPHENGNFMINDLNDSEYFSHLKPVHILVVKREYQYYSDKI